MKRCKRTSDRSPYVLALVVLALIGVPITFGQEGELVIRPIRNIVATSNATPVPHDMGPENTVNGSGLNANGEHSTSHGLWLSNPADGLLYIQYEFDRAYELLEMKVWNYNETWGAMLGFAVKDITIEYSENATDWTVLGDVQCAEASYRADYVANTIVPLDGIVAQYVRLTILSKWGTSRRAGLSEVQFLVFAEVDYPISNVVATSNAISEHGSSPQNTVNRSGLGANDGHSTELTDMWLAELGEPDDDPVYIQYEFADVYELNELWVWNFNSGTWAEVKDVTIEYSENGTDWTILRDVQFAQASCEPGYVANTFVDLGGILAKYVRLTVLSPWTDNGQAGLAEVRFTTRQASLSYATWLDDFETYGDGADPNEPILFDVWADGWANGTRSQVGHLLGPFVERRIVHGGSQSMPLFYNNAASPYYSEADRDLEPQLQDWYVDGADALTLYFHGSTEKDHNTDTDRLYVALGDNLGRLASVHHPDPEALLSDKWQKWMIGFEEFGDVDLSHVVRLTLGIGDPDDPQAGGNSVVYIDDIGLIARPAQTEMEP